MLSKYLCFSCLMLILVGCSSQKTKLKENPKLNSDFNDVGSIADTNYIVRPNNLVALKSQLQRSEKKNSLIAAVQLKLNKYGLKVGAADGRIGKRTIAGIKKFQKRKKLAVTGRLNADTLRTLGVDQGKYSRQTLSTNTFAE